MKLLNFENHRHNPRKNPSNYRNRSLLKALYNSFCITRKTTGTLQEYLSSSSHKFDLCIQDTAKHKGK